jgi:hypothetical protein
VAGPARDGTLDINIEHDATEIKQERVGMAGTKSCGGFHLKLKHGANYNNQTQGNPRRWCRQQREVCP